MRIGILGSGLMSGKLQVGVLIIRRDPRVAYFHGPILSLIYGTAKPLIYRGREVVSKILIYGTANTIQLREASRLASC
jgi:hypothetical protein